MFQQILAGIHADLITISCYRLQLNTICISFPQKRVKQAEGKEVMHLF